MAQIFSSFLFLQSGLSEALGTLFVNFFHAFFFFSFSIDKTRDASSLVVPLK